MAKKIDLEYHKLQSLTNQLVRSDRISNLFTILEDYLNENNREVDNRNMFSLISNDYTDFKKNKLTMSYSLEDENRMRKRLNYKILEFVGTLKPPSYSEEDFLGLRYKVDWDNNSSLNIILQFKGGEYNHHNDMFERLIKNKNWEKYVDFVYLFVDPAKNTKQILRTPDEAKNIEQFLETEEGKKEHPLGVVKKELLQDRNAVIFKKIYQVDYESESENIEDTEDVYKMESNIEYISKMLVEKDEKKSKITIRVNGLPKYRCIFLNELMDFFELYKIDNEHFSLTIPSFSRFGASNAAENIINFNIEIDAELTHD